MFATLEIVNDESDSNNDRNNDNSEDGDHDRNNDECNDGNSESNDGAGDEEITGMGWEEIRDSVTRSRKGVNQP
ncbi:hypothetical protein PsorP6_018807 [Peronosclerospora sorghi]|nr:hypothetical protein PsorP6_018798 [Peronosclerospora sorghi]KAI9895209.1 hypothetical protein PsorP6_018807 [Peronosclerospora sorghi]